MKENFKETLYETNVGAGSRGREKGEGRRGMEEGEEGIKEMRNRVYLRAAADDKIVVTQIHLQ